MTRNTTLIGDTFEEKVFQIMKTLLNNDKLSVQGKNSQIFKKKPYYSLKRDSEIIFDIAIETYIDNSKEPALLTLIECKDLNSSLTVDNIEEFSHKIEQVGGHKGIIIVNNKVQSGGLNIAKNERIAIAKVTNDNLCWELYRKNKDSVGKENCTISIVQDIKELLVNSGIIDYKSDTLHSLKVPFQTEGKIIEITTRLQKYELYKDFLLDTEKLKAFISEKYEGLKIVHEDLAVGVLGKLDIHSLKISINNSLLSDKNRYRFTLVHEIGHLVLHKELLKKAGIDVLDSNSSIFHTIDGSNSRYLEVQANIFASHLLIPNNLCEELVKEYLKDKDIKEAYIYFDFQPCNQALGQDLIGRVSYRFGVSAEVARIKLTKLGYLRNTISFDLFKTQ